MPAMRGTLLALGVGTLLLAGGCKSLSCANPDTYNKAAEVPPLKMPVGLDGPDTKQALKIPALNEPEVPRDPDGACLEDPPVMDTSGLPAGLQPPPDTVPGAGPAEAPPPPRRTRPVSPPR
jgi:hypothetical protein